MRLARAIALLLLAAHQIGCAAWRPIGRESPAGFVTRRSPDLVRIAVADSALVLRHPIVRGDSLIGLASGSVPPRRAEVSLDSIRTFEVRLPGGSTGARIAVGAVGLSAIVMVVLLATQRGYEIP